MVSREQASIELLAILDRYTTRRLVPSAAPGQKAAIRWLLASNDKLATALIHLRDSYCVQLAEHPIKGSDEILAEVAGSLRNAAKAKSVI